MWEYARRLELLDTIAAKSGMSEKDALAIGRVVKRGLAERYAEQAGLPSFTRQSKVLDGLKKGLSRLSLPVLDRSPYDRFMLHFHDWLKENSEFQKQPEGKERLEFPPMATWLVFTDGVPHAALSGQFAMEQTFIIPVGALVAPEAAPIRVLERISGRTMA